MYDSCAVIFKLQNVNMVGHSQLITTFPLFTYKNWARCNHFLKTVLQLTFIDRTNICIAFVKPAKLLISQLVLGCQ